MSPFGTAVDEIETDSTFETLCPLRRGLGYPSRDFGQESPVWFGDQLFGA